MTLIEMGGIGLDGRNEMFYSSHVKLEKEISYPGRDVK